MDAKIVETVATLTAAALALPESRRQFLMGYAEGVIARDAQLRPEALISVQPQNPEK